ncbi:MAG: hypothetical protein AAGD01_05090 [Acidobacteriota bacterium]
MMRLTRPLFIALALLVLLLPPPSDAQDCSPGKIQELKTQCLSILRDAAGTANEGHQLDRQAFEKSQEANDIALVESIKAGKTLANLIAKCRPISPGCAAAVAKVPGHVKELKKAYDLYKEAEALWKQAGFFYGTAGVAFSEQGGDGIADQLKACGEDTCFEVAQALRRFADESKARAQRNQDRANRAAANVQLWIDALEGCKDNPETCEAPAPLTDPGFESPSPEVPDIPQG